MLVQRHPMIATSAELLMDTPTDNPPDCAYTAFASRRDGFETKPLSITGKNGCFNNLLQDYEYTISVEVSHPKLGKKISDEKNIKIGKHNTFHKFNFSANYCIYICLYIVYTVL